MPPLCVCVCVCWGGEGGGGEGPLKIDPPELDCTASMSSMIPVTLSVPNSSLIWLGRGMIAEEPISYAYAACMTCSMLTKARRSPDTLTWVGKAAVQAIDSGLTHMDSVDLLGVQVDPLLDSLASPDIQHLNVPILVTQEGSGPISCAVEGRELRLLI